MILPKITKPKNPRFSCGPTKKPDGWSLTKIDKEFLGRYHRSSDVKYLIHNQLERIKQILKIPDNFKILLTPASCSGAMESIIWSLLGKRRITSIIFDHWGKAWNESMQKLNYRIDYRASLDGTMPNLENIPSENDIIFVWTGTSIGMCINDLDFISPNHGGLVVSDITSAAFIYDLPWNKIDAAAFSWQKALGSESQHGIVVMSPKAINRLKSKPIPKIFNLLENDFVVNTPSLLTISDLKLCLDLYEANGGLKKSFKICEENKTIIDKWEKKSSFVNYYVKNKSYQSITPVYMTFANEFNYDKLFDFLSLNKIAYDIKNYRKCEPGIRIWTGPTIKKNDLIALTNWLDWSFNNLFNK